MAKFRAADEIFRRLYVHPSRDLPKQEGSSGIIINSEEQVRSFMTPYGTDFRDAMRSGSIISDKKPGRGTA